MKSHSLTPNQQLRVLWPFLGVAIHKLLLSRLLCVVSYVHNIFCLVRLDLSLFTTYIVIGCFNQVCKTHIHIAHGCELKSPLKVMLSISINQPSYNMGIRSSNHQKPFGYLGVTLRRAEGKPWGGLRNYLDPLTNTLTMWPIFNLKVVTWACYV